MMKRKAPLLTSSQDVITVSTKRNTRRKLHHSASPSNVQSTSRTVDCVLIPAGERPHPSELSFIEGDPSDDDPSELSAGVEANPSDRQPIFERPLICDGKRSRTKSSQRQRTHVEAYGRPYHSEIIQPNVIPRRVNTTSRIPRKLPISSPDPLHQNAPAIARNKLSTVSTRTDAPERHTPLHTPVAGPILNEDSNQNVSRSFSQRPRRSTAKQSYVEDNFEDEDDDEEIKYETRSAKAHTPDSDFGIEESDQDSSIESEEVSQLEDGESEGSDGGYDSDIKNKRKPSSRKATKKTEAKAPGISKTGRATGKASSTGMAKLLGRETSQPKGLDTSLAPLSSINDIFEDITTRALANGLREVLKKMTRPLRVATMCSGTESPLLALEMIQDALKSLDETELKVDHLFSAEIVPYKQAYIERNFHPKIIFRDITEITKAVEEEFPQATTAYGAMISIPDDVDILIAGTSCVDFSRLNKYRKDLSDEAGGESSKTWHGVLSYVKAFRPAIVILENVKSAPYDRMMGYYRDIGYEVGGVLLDTKNYYLPQTRQRGYLVCYDMSKAPTHIGGAGKKWESLMSDFRRYASSSVADFMLPNDKIQAQQDGLESSGSKEYDWAACEIRHIQYRQEKQLGNARPWTFWSESGIMNIPENGNISWYNKRPERERDFMDIAYLRKAMDGFDVRYKTRIWDLSQNIDMSSDSTHFGIAPCTTPGGTFFASDAGRALAPEELLGLQGLPLNKVSFTTETRNEIQDLAGNAMSTTAVGPAILAALICGQSVLQDYEGPSNITTTPLPPKLTEVPLIRSAKSNDQGQLDLARLLDEAHRSARRCLCESSVGIAQKPIQQCIDCSHTSCTRCGGNPAHNYHARTVVDVRVSPLQFEAYLRSNLPGSLTLGKQPSDLYRLSDDYEYIKAVVAAVGSTFTFSRVLRTHVWTAEYKSPAAKLELRLDGQRASWHMFALPVETLPVNNGLRKSLEQPVATSNCDTSLFDGKWLWRCPPSETTQVCIRGVGKRIASWLARLELPKYLDEQVWERLQIQVPSSLAESIGYDLSGEYEALPLCGTASDSLYKKIGTVAANGEQIYLLRNPTRAGDPKLDSFIFSTEKERLDFGVERPVIATFDPTWTPWNNGEAFDTASLIPSGDWRSLHTRLQEVDLQVDIYTPRSLNQVQLDCHQAELVMKCNFASRNLDSRRSGDIDPKDDGFFSEYAHILELMRRQLPTSTWSLPFCQSCDSCAPSKPDLRWMLTDRLKGEIKPYEDPRSAAVYEQSIKSRPRPMLLRFAQAGDEARAGASTIHFGVNLASLAHRAVARLPSATASSPSRLEWKLEQNLASGSKIRRDPFILQPTCSSDAPATDIGMTCSLFPKQALVLQWMQQQELGQVFTVEETEEATIPPLGWRAEVRAETDITVRGGICADHPGFGKTITSLALIHSHLDSDKDIVADLRVRQESTSRGHGLLATKATLIVSPKTLVKQWAGEIKSKLGYTEGVLVIGAVRDLDNFTIEDFEKAKIIVVDRTVLVHQDYAERLASFAAIPGPAATSGRAFSQWLSRACKAIPEHLGILQNDGLKCLKIHVRDLYAKLIESEELHAVIPSRRLIGKEYVAAQAKIKTTDKPALKAVPTSNLHLPLFEMFFFNRIIVDEFHQYDAREYASLKALKADKRWGLSGTPALTDSCDIARIAELLNVPLRIGSNSSNNMTERNRKVLRKDMTDFELFDAMREVPSDHVHARIREIAQKFLDTFVCQNYMDFEDMTYADYLAPVTLDVDHLVAYTELSQQLASQDMNIRKAKKSKTTTRDMRFMAAIDGSDTAEEVLSRDAAFFERSDGLGLEHMITARRLEVNEMLGDLRNACYAAQHELNVKNQPLQHTISTLLHDGTLGDAKTIKHVLQIIKSTVNRNATSPKTKSKSKTQKNTFDSDGETEKSREGAEISKARELAAKVNALAKGLLTSVRSERYISNVHTIRGSTSTKCDGESCGAKGKRIAVSALCGHRVCDHCQSRSKAGHSTQCVAAPRCSAPQQDHHLLWSDKLHSSGKTRHGAKLEAVVQILEGIRNKSEKAILFVQYQEQVDQAAAAFEEHELAATIVATNTAGAQIASFCQNKDTVLVLNASDETAAGSNIQAANHVIFLSPLLRDNQYSYDSTMAQAIGRVRRHGQKRRIHVYRICALHTIDVDILEHREYRANALVEPGADLMKPPPGGLRLVRSGAPKKDRVQLVRNENDGSYSLRPRFWLTQGGTDNTEHKTRSQGWNRVAGWEDFSSQVKFSRAYGGDD
jgi:site-specific DNA-cytosine methylase